MIKMLKSSYLLFIGLMMSFTLLGQNSNIEVDNEFTNLFARDCCGVTGADGMYSVLMPNGQTLWIFGDSFLGTVNEDGSRDKIDPVFVRNAVALQNGDELKTYFNTHDGRDASFLIPPNAPVGKVYSEDSLWFWPGDAYVEGETLKIYLSAFYQAGEGGWGFKWTGCWLASLNVSDLSLISMDEIDIPMEPEIHWGHAVCDEDKDHLYIYGLGDGKPYVARVDKNKDGSCNDEDVNNWEYYSNKKWTTDYQKISPMYDFQGSEQFSVFKHGDKYIYLSQKGGFSKEIASSISDNPYDGWYNTKTIYTIPDFKNENLFAYNALAHPQFIKKGKLLISFCVNSFEMGDVFTDANNYRARFIRVDMRNILKEDYK